MYGCFLIQNTALLQSFLDVVSESLHTCSGARMRATAESPANPRAGKARAESLFRAAACQHEAPYASGTVTCSEGKGRERSCRAGRMSCRIYVQNRVP